jgi:endonuclease-3
MTPVKSEKIIKILSEFYGDVKPDLDFSNIYELTIAVVLSAQTTDKQVNSVTGVLFTKYPDFKSLAEARITDVEKIIKSTGFYHAKAKNIVMLAKKIVSTFNGSPPPDMDSLLTLPGVGRKSANVILSIGFGIPGLAVDTHVGRIAKRLGYTERDTPDRVEKDLCSIIRPGEWRDTHLLFIWHGRAICKARNPECGLCPVSGQCVYFRKLSAS